MPAPGEQHNSTTANPFEEVKPRMSEYTAQEIATLQSRLDKQLGPEFISSRPGPSGQKVHYLAAEKCINLANEVFGFNGWSSAIKEVQVDFVDENAATGKICLGLSVIVRVSLRDGTFHEDIGYGHIENCKDKAAAFEKAKKEGTTDALKRALRNFGNVLGNCVYDKSYLSKVTKIKVGPGRWDIQDLHRHADFAPVKKEPAADSDSSHTASEAPQGKAASMLARTTAKGPKAAQGALDEDEFETEDFDEADFGVADGDHPDEVVLDAASTVNAHKNGGLGQTAPTSISRGPPPRPQTMKAQIQAQPVPPAQAAAALNPTPTTPRAMHHPQANHSTTANPAQHQAHPNQNQYNRHNLPPHPQNRNPTSAIQNAPQHNIPQNQHPQNRPQPYVPNRNSTSTSHAPVQSHNIPNQHPNARPHGPQNHLPNTSAAPPPPQGQPPQPDAPGPAAGFYTARAAESLQAGAAPPPHVAPPFNPHAESPSIRKTAGFDHSKTMPVTRKEEGTGPAIPGPAAAPARASGGGGGPLTRSHNVANVANPQADPSRRIGAPQGAGASPMANRGMYKPPLKRPAEGNMQGGGRTALHDVTSNSINVPGDAGNDPKRQRVGGPGPVAGANAPSA